MGGGWEGVGRGGERREGNREKERNDCVIVYREKPSLKHTLTTYSIHVHRT